MSDQIGVKIIFEGNNNSLKVQKNYFCNGTKITDLGALSTESNAYCINNNGQIVGYSCNYGETHHIATLWNVTKVPVHPVRPVANFVGTPTRGKAPLNVQFTDKSENNPTSWSWKFGDGSTSTTQSPSHKYTKKGTYSVSLTVKNTAGSNTTTKSKYITVK